MLSRTTQQSSHTAPLASLRIRCDHKQRSWCRYVSGRQKKKKITAWARFPKRHSLWKGAGGGALSTPPSCNRHPPRSLQEKRGVGRLMPTFMVSIHTWRPWTRLHKLQLSVLTCQLQWPHCTQINCCRNIKSLISNIIPVCHHEGCSSVKGNKGGSIEKPSLGFGRL